MLLLNLLPAPLHRMLYRVAHFARRQVWRVWKPATEGVRVLALDPQGRVLLVRHSYGPPAWMPPGGGLHHGEDPVPAGTRELLEETGCVLEGGRIVALNDEDLHGANNKVRVLVGITQGQPHADGREIVAARFFALDALPDDLSPALAARIPAWVALYRA